jgi:hypothetical protein
LPKLEVVVVPPLEVAVGVGAGDETGAPGDVGDATVTGAVVTPETGVGAESGDVPIVAPPLQAASATSAIAGAIEREKRDENMGPRGGGMTNFIAGGGADSIA